MLWFFLLQCNFLCRQSVILICGVKSCQILLVPSINLLIYRAVLLSVFPSVTCGSQHIPSSLPGQWETSESVLAQTALRIPIFVTKQGMLWQQLREVASARPLFWVTIPLNKYNISRALMFGCWVLAEPGCSRSKNS